MTYTVRGQVIKIYDVYIDAKDEDDAIQKFYDMQTKEIRENGRFVDATTDHAEIQDAERRETLMKAADSRKKWKPDPRTPPIPVEWPLDSTSFIGCYDDVGIKCYYSFGELIAFRDPRQRDPYVAQNIWSKKTGRHLNLIDDGETSKRIPHDELLASYWRSHNQLQRRLQHLWYYLKEK